MRITANLATRPFADLGPALKRLRIGMGVLALVAVALGAGLYALHTKAVEARAREHILDSSISTVRHEQQTYEALVQEPQNAQVLSQSAALNRIFDEKAFSWTLAMEDLETVLPGGVQVTTLEPIRDKKDGHITLRMRVVGPRDKAVELVQNLERSRHFLLPRITGESAESQGNGANPALEPISMSNRVNFDLLADYNPVPPEERKEGAKKDAKDDASGVGSASTRHAARRIMPARRHSSPGNATPKPASHTVGGPR